LKKDKDNAKKAKELADHEAGKRLDRKEKIHANIKAVRMDMKQKHEEILSKIPQTVEKVNKV
jgi:hypothetical protein